MKIVEQGDRRLVISVAQDSYHFMPALFFASAVVILALGMITGNIDPAWRIGLGVVFVALGLFFLGYSKKDRFAFDADSGDIEVKTRQFWRDTTYRIPLDLVSGVDVFSSGDHETSLHALQFIGPTGRPLEFKRYVEPGPRLGVGVDAMQKWLKVHGHARPTKTTPPTTATT